MNNHDVNHPFYRWYISSEGYILTQIPFVWRDFQKYCNTVLWPTCSEDITTCVIASLVCLSTPPFLGIISIGEKVRVLLWDQVCPGHFEAELAEAGIQGPGRAGEDGPDLPHLHVCKSLILLKLQIFIFLMSNVYIPLQRYTTMTPI